MQKENIFQILPPNSQRVLKIFWNLLDQLSNAVKSTEC